MSDPLIPPSEADQPRPKRAVRRVVDTWYNGFDPDIRSESFHWMKAEIIAGRISPPSKCSACGETRGHIDYHAEDYSRPFGPHIHEWELCFRCHMMLHIRYRRNDHWLRYIERLEAGAIYEPLMSRREIFKINGSAWIDNPPLVGSPRGVLVFFRGLSLVRNEGHDVPAHTAPESS